MHTHINTTFNYTFNSLYYNICIYFTHPHHAYKHMQESQEWQKGF